MFFEVKKKNIFDHKTCDPILKNKKKAFYIKNAFFKR